MKKELALALIAAIALSGVVVATLENHGTTPGQIGQTVTTSTDSPHLCPDGTTWASKATHCDASEPPVCEPCYSCDGGATCIAE